MKLTRSTLDKARSINTNLNIYGTFAEIGAGQEVARFFFLAGKASQTIAKTMSAYDMIYSDEIYGKEKTGRYVCESRVLKMLEKEYSLLLRRLNPSRGATTQFFAFADTVATGDGVKKVSHGWLGVRFQTKPEEEPSDLIIHVRLLDKYRLMQQEVLGVLGVNMVACAFESLDKQTHVIDALTENIKQGQVSIDYLKITGPAAKHLDQTALNIELVQKKWADCVLFNETGEIASVTDSIFDQGLLIDRGHFRPLTNSHLNLMDKGRIQFQKEFPKEKSPKVLCEIVLDHASKTKKRELKIDDLKKRIRFCSSMNLPVLISNFNYFYQLKNYVRQATKKPLAFIMSIQHLDGLFNESFYQNLEGGLLEGLGRLLDQETHLYIYPEAQKNECLSCDSYQAPKGTEHIYKHFAEHKMISDMVDCDHIQSFVHSTQIEQWMKQGSKEWEKHVPPSVRDILKKEGL
jgi:hypothetical protein